MPTYLLAWNPKRRRWDDFAALWHALRLQQNAVSHWDVGNAKRIRVGDRLFWIRVGEEPRGIFASGYAQSDVEVQAGDGLTNGAADKPLGRVAVEFDVLLDSAQEPILLRAVLDEAPLADMHWNLQTPAANIPADTAAQLETRWQDFLRENNA